tara:strand:- start:197 stop:382 length:186 start_codon:yes stop_codon:yes gene_type:complete
MKTFETLTSHQMKQECGRATGNVLPTEMHEANGFGQQFDDPIEAGAIHINVQAHVCEMQGV